MALKLPNSYVDVDRDEMEYVDGGFYVTNTQLKSVIFAAGASGVSVAAIQGAAYGIGAIMATTIPGLGWITGGLLLTYAGAFALNAAYAIKENKGMNIRLTIPWGLSFEVA